MNVFHYIHPLARSLGLALLIVAGAIASGGGEPAKPKEPPVSAEQYAKWLTALERSQQQLQTEIQVQEDRLAKAQKTQEKAESALSDLERKKADAEAEAARARRNSYSWTDSYGNTHYSYGSRGSGNPPPTRMGEGAGQKVTIAQAQAEATDAEKQLGPLRKQLTDVQAKIAKLKTLMAASPSPQPVAPAPIPVPDPGLDTAKKPESTESSDWTLYSKDRQTKTLLYGRLVEKSTLKVFTGFLQHGPVDAGDGLGPREVWLLNLAKHRGDSSSGSHMELRPSNWKPTGELIVLVGYQPDDQSEHVIRVGGIELDPIGTHRALAVSREPTFEEWQKLRTHE
jgi:hypothetical protein